MNSTEAENATDEPEPPWWPPEHRSARPGGGSVLVQIGFFAVSCLIPILFFAPQLWPLLAVAGAGFLVFFCAVLATNRRRTGRGALLFLLLLVVPVAAILVVLGVGYLSME